MNATVPTASVRVPVEWQSRVIEEKVELDKKLGALKAFFGSLEYSKLERPDQMLMVEQRGAMQDYSNILRDRISRFR